MKQKMVYQSIVDLKELRKNLGLTKEFVADNIGYMEKRKKKRKHNLSFFV